MINDNLKKVRIIDYERFRILAKKKRWQITKIIDDIWIIVDQIKLWVSKYNFCSFYLLLT